VHFQVLEEQTDDAPSSQEADDEGKPEEVKESGAYMVTCVSEHLTGPEISQACDKETSRKELWKAESTDTTIAPCRTAVQSKDHGSEHESFTFPFKPAAQFSISNAARRKSSSLTRESCSSTREAVYITRSPGRTTESNANDDDEDKYEPIEYAMLDYMHHVPESLVHKVKGNLQKHDDLVEQLRKTNDFLRKREIKKKEWATKLKTIHQGLEQVVHAPGPSSPSSCTRPAGPSSPSSCTRPPRPPKSVNAEGESGEALLAFRVASDTHTQHSPPVSTPVKSNQSNCWMPEAKVCSHGSIAAAARAAQLQKASESPQVETRFASANAYTAESPSQHVAGNRRSSSWTPEVTTSSVRRVDPTGLTKTKTQIAEIQDAIRIANAKCKRNDAERRALAWEAMKEIGAIRGTTVSGDMQVSTLSP